MKHKFEGYCGGGIYSSITLDFYEDVVDIVYDNGHAQFPLTLGRDDLIDIMHLIKAFVKHE